jgi:hypothetical protein
MARINEIMTNFTYNLNLFSNALDVHRALLQQKLLKLLPLATKDATVEGVGVCASVCAAHT